MITGFNTDISYEGTTYHVQTEDKGVATPVILSLVYDRGTILASKRSPYDDLLVDGFDEKSLTERLQKQHKLMCAAIRGGRIEDLKRMTMKESASRQKGLIAQKEIKPAAGKKEPAQIEIAIEDIPIPLPQILKGKRPLIEKNRKGTGAIEESFWDIPLMVLEDPVGEEEIILPAEAVEIISEAIDSEPDDNSLKVELLDNPVFKGGERKTINFIVRRGNQKRGLSGSQVLVKILGSTFRPLIFHAKTDDGGIATIHLQMPHFKSGRAAILVKAMDAGEETELRRVIQQG